MVNLLAFLPICKHLLFGLNNGFRLIGLKPCHRSIDFSDEYLVQLSMNILLSRGGMMILLMMRLLQKEGVRLHRDDLRKRLLYISAPCFSLKPSKSSLKLFVRIKGRPTYVINHIEILPSDGSPHLVHLLLKTLSKPPKPWYMTDSEHMGVMPQDNKVYVFDAKEVETKELKDRRSKATQNSFSICAKQGEYYAQDKDKGSIVLSFQQTISRTVKDAHGWFICAIAFHQTLPLLATYCGLKEEKKLKIWYIPSGLSSDPVLVSSFHIPEGCVLSVTFHPTLPLIFCGKDNGDIEVWRAV
jgi:WD40 repeat protein